METVAYWHTYHECPQIWEAYEKWNPETFVKIVAPAVAEVMAKSLIMRKD